MSETDKDTPSQDADDGYREAFYTIAEVLGMWAMPISPKEAFETVMLPKIRALFFRREPEWCPLCNASGEITVSTSHLGPDDYEHEVTCPHCNGDQTLAAAYAGVIKLLDEAGKRRIKDDARWWDLHHTPYKSSDASAVYRVENAFRHRMRIEDAETLRNLRDKLEALARAAEAQAPAAHPDDACVDRLAAAMKLKLKHAREVMGRGGWEECDQPYLSALLHDHVRKGDPLDVANFCAFLFAKGWGIGAAP